MYAFLLTPFFLADQRSFANGNFACKFCGKLIEFSGTKVGGINSHLGKSSETANYTKVVEFNFEIYQHTSRMHTLTLKPTFNLSSCVFEYIKLAYANV